MEFTRRKWVALIAASPAIAQTSSTVPVPPQAAPAGGLKKAVDDVRSTSERLAQIEVPMNIEPAFSFKA